MNEAERQIRLRLRDDFKHYALRCLKIRTKSGQLLPFELNAAQRLIHDEMQQQIEERNFVRLVLPKARQLGSSTYVGGRYFWRVTNRFGLKACILTHEAKATANLFEMVERYYAHLPPLVKPVSGTDNANELTFPKLDSGYLVGTAGAKGFGRSFTFQLFHGSEVAFWPNSQAHFDGAIQAVPLGEGSEIVLESTGNGVGGPFWQTTMSAIKKIGDFRMLFLGWWLDPAYSRPAPREWRAPQPWRDYASAYGLEEDQLYWAYMKNADRCANTGEEPDVGPSWRFQQEYPATVMECFQAGGEGAFINNRFVVAARKRLVEASDTMIIGVDPARGGGDKTGVIDRRGRVLGKLVCETWDIASTHEIAERCAQLIRKHKPNVMAIDITGVGAGVYDTLVAFGFERVVHAVTFGGTAQEPLRYVNRRAEIWDRMRQWLSDETAVVAIPDRDDLHVDLTAPLWGSPGGCKFVGERLQMEPKDHIRERLGVSPDLGDAAALTFAVPPVLAMQEVAEREPQKQWRPF